MGTRKKTSDGMNERNPVNGQMLPKYKPEYPQMLIDHLAEGLSFESFGGLVKVSHQALYLWLDAHPEFKLAKQIGIAQSQLFWERMGMAATIGKIPNFIPSLWIFNMKNRFNWRDRKEVKNLEEDKEFGEVTHEKIMDYIEGKKF